jgi:RND superfamily putative drug exporter
LEQLADRVGQLPNIAQVSGVTRPMGAVPEQFRATYQAGAIGARLGSAADLISDHTDDLNRLARGSNTLADNLRDVRGQVNQMVASIQGLVDAFSSMRNQYGGDKLVSEVETAAKLVNSINSLGTTMGLNFAAVKDLFGWVAPVLTALQGNPICNADPSCSDTRVQFERVVNARSDGSLDQINDLARQLQVFPDRQTLKASAERLHVVLTSFTKALHAMGLDRPGGLQADLTNLQQGADRFAGGSRQVADGVDQLVEQIKQLGAGLGDASAFLLAMKQDAAEPSMAGFNIPPQLLRME